MTALAPTVPPRRRRLAPRRTLISMAVALALAQYGTALAGPGGAQVVAGQVAVSQPTAQQTVVTQGSANAIVNWQQFSIARGESVDFRQPGSASVILNRVTGSNPSEIYGRLSANGQVFLVNPGGVLFGRTAQVSVGGLVASTLDIADADFVAGRYRFAAGPVGGAVVNQGQLQAAERGTVALLGAKVNNDGTISAQLGTAALVAGDKIALDFNGDGLTKIRVDKAAVAALVDNRGMVVADGGQAILTAHAAQALAETVLNQQGVVRARSLVERNGRISLDGGERGVTLASGTLDVSGSAPGLKGGTAEVLGHHVGLFGNALIDARGDAGGGTILVGGDYGGANPLVRNADATFAGPSTVLRADATGSGDGGKVILWSDHSTRVFGTASASGGPRGGNGGFIETSGKFLDVAGSKVSAAAPRGRAGQWLLDPDNIRITTCLTCGPPNITEIPAPPGSREFTTSGDAILAPATLVAALGAGTSVTVTTGNQPQSQSLGDITVEATIQYLGAGEASLTLAAHNDIVINPGVFIRSGNGNTNDSNVGRLNVTLRSNRDELGGGSILMDTGSGIFTNGGNVLFAGGASTNPAQGFASRVQLDTGARITTTRPGGGDGSVTMRADYGGTTSAEAILLSGASIRSGAGAVSLEGASNGNLNNLDVLAGNAGVRLQQAFLSGTPPVPSTIETTSGNISITGKVSALPIGQGRGGMITGVSLYDSSIQTGSGVIVINGTGGNTSTIAVPGGRAIGIDMSNFLLHANQGSARLTGIGGNAIGETSGTFDGVASAFSTIDSTGGAIDIRGRAGVAPFAAPTGVALVGSTVATSGAPGAITISGESPGASLGVSLSDAIDPSRANLIGGANTTGVISIRALNASPGGNMLALGGTIQGSGVLNLHPGGVSATGALTEAPAVPIGLFGAGAPFALGQSALTQVIQPGFSSVVIGSATHTGPITVAAGANLAGRSDLTLQNGGAGSGGIALAGSFANAGKMLMLSSGGTVTQAGPIVAGSLLLHGTQPESNFQLINPLNAVGTFSARFDAPKGAGDPNFGDVNFFNGGDLAFGPLTGTGFDAGANLPVAINAGNALVAGDLLAHAGHDLILHQNISTGASDITLVADHVFLNPANAALAPGGGGHWKVFADTWQGENAGPLAGTGPTPNLYNCGYGAACTAALPAAENFFVYRQQPRVDITLDVPNPARVYGSPNPPFNFTPTGLVKQDKFGTAVTGAYSSLATAASNVQSYPIDGQFVSPAGYLVVAAPGTLRVDPATLTYLATPAVRLAGSAGPPLTGSVSGLLNGDTLEGATTGTPSFSTPAGLAAPPGRYAINGAGLAARNYVFVQAPSNATALRVEPSIFGKTPGILNEVTFATSALYGKNFGVQRLCAGSGPLARADGAPDASDPLSIEWSRVKDNPNLSNCIGLVQRYSCDNF